MWKLLWMAILVLSIYHTDASRKIDKDAIKNKKRPAQFLEAPFFASLKIKRDENSIVIDSPKEYYYTTPKTDGYVYTKRYVYVTPTIRKSTPGITYLPPTKITPRTPTTRTTTTTTPRTTTTIRTTTTPRTTTTSTTTPRTTTTIRTTTTTTPRTTTTTTTTPRTTTTTTPSTTTSTFKPTYLPPYKYTYLPPPEPPRTTIPIKYETITYPPVKYSSLPPIETTSYRYNYTGRPYAAPILPSPTPTIAYPLVKSIRLTMNNNKFFKIRSVIPYNTGRSYTTPTLPSLTPNRPYIGYEYLPPKKYLAFKPRK